MTDKNVVQGKIKNAEGVVQEQVGKLTNDPNTQAEGVAKQVTGKAQETVGHVNDAVRAAADAATKDLN